MGSQPVIQTSFNSGEWAPALYGRVDLTKYHSGAALLQNFFIDYRGGATIRPGSKYVLQTFKTSTVRLIPFQASFTVSYILEFGDQYIRFHHNGQPVLELPTNITSAVAGPPEVFTDTAHGYNNGDWVFVQNAYFIVQNVTANTFTLTDLFGNAINSNPFTLPAASQRVYTIASPFLAGDLALVKFAQNVNILILCHQNYPPQQLILTSATSWAISAIPFGATIGTPAGQAVATTLAAGSVNYAYQITAVDTNGQESPPSAFATLSSVTDIRTVAGTNTVTWTAVTGAVSYNVYRANPRYGSAVPAGSDFGFVGNVTATTFIDSNINPDFSQGPPVPENPFQGSGVQSITLTAKGTGYKAVPSITLTAAPGGGTTAQAFAYLEVDSVSLASAGQGYFNNNNNVLHATIGLGNGIQFDASCQFGSVISFTQPNNNGRGTVTSNPIPTNPITDNGLGFNGGNTLGGWVPSTWNVTWRVSIVVLSNPGAGYAVAPSVTFTGGTPTIIAAATTVLGAPSAGNPAVPSFFQQRLVLAGPVGSPGQFNMSQTGAYYNYNVNAPIEADNAIQGTLVANTLNSIQSMISQPYGLILFTDKGAWLLNGGAPQSAVEATGPIVANPQIYNGASYQPPIVANDNILYIQSKGSIVRNLIFNYYTQIYTGNDITVLSSHLFYGFQLLEWAYAEEPFKIIWAVRNDGVMLSLTFLREQELIAWSHHITQGNYKSIASVVEPFAFGNIDAVYTVVQRTVQGQVVQYIERFAQQSYPNGAANAWQVDAGIQYTGAPALSFFGAQQLGGLTVTGLQTDDQGNVTVIPSFTMPTSGSFTLAAPPGPATGYTVVTIGIPFQATLTTLPLDLGEPTVQGKRKKITGVTLKVVNALGLSMGRTAASAIPLQDLVIGNLGSMSNLPVTNLVSDNVRGIIDPLWDVPGQYTIQQLSPYPASILAVVPEISVGDTPE